MYAAQHQAIGRYKLVAAGQFNSLEMCFLFTNICNLVGTELIIIMTEDNSVNDMIGYRLEEPGYSFRNDIEDRL
jgi:hypothetical protein